MDEASSGAAGPGSDGTTEWGPPPREHALAYPGRWPSGSVLLTGDAHWPLICQRDRRVGLTLVDWTQGSAPPADATRRRVPLHYALLSLGAAAVDHRVPVLAVGSNASPAQLRHKFQPSRDHGLNGDSADRFDGLVPSVIPMIEADVEGMQVGVAAQVAPYGALPATPVFGAGLSCRLFVQFLDPHQLCRMDETEDVDNPDGGYERIYLPADGDAEAPVRVRLPSGEVLGACYAYVAKGGYLADPLSGAQPRPLAALDQETQLANLLAASDRLRGELGETPQAWVDTVSANPTEAEGTVLRILADEGWVASAAAEIDAAGATPVTSTAAPRLYRDLLPHDEQGQGPSTFRIVPSVTPKERPDESMVLLNPAAADAAFPEGTARYAAVSGPTDDPSTQRLEVLARVMLDPAVPERCIQTDHVIRVALGVEIGEPVKLTPRRTVDEGRSTGSSGRPAT